MTKEVSLENEWRIFFESEKKNTDWSDHSHIQPLHSFATIQEFWSLFNSLSPALSNLKNKEAFHLMKKINDKSIMPIWEDPENKLGGEHIFRVEKKDAAEAWQSLVLGVIGEQFATALNAGDDICGLSVSPRQIDFVFNLWHKRSDSPKKEVLLERVKELLPTGVTIFQTPYYKAHQ